MLPVDGLGHGFGFAPIVLADIAPPDIVPPDIEPPDIVFPDIAPVVLTQCFVASVFIAPPAIVPPDIVPVDILLPPEGPLIEPPAGSAKACEPMNKAAAAPIIRIRDMLPPRMLRQPRYSRRNRFGSLKRRVRNFYAAKAIFVTGKMSE
jgi:hypothetical protein